MAPEFYQDELTRGTDLAPATRPPGRAADVPGRGLATLMHLLLVVAGPVGLALHVVVTLLVGRDPRPLVRGTNDAILRFAGQLLVLFGLGVALVLTGHEEWAVPPLVLMAAAYLFLPLLAALQTWRTGRVFRYPVWDLLRRRR